MWNIEICWKTSSNISKCPETIKNQSRSISIIVVYTGRLSGSNPPTCNVGPAKTLFRQFFKNAPWTICHLCLVSEVIIKHMHVLANNLCTCTYKPEVWRSEWRKQLKTLNKCAATFENKLNISLDKTYTS